MSTTQERLDQLERADFDTFGVQNAGPGQQPLATPEEVADIKTQVTDAPWNDPARYPECIRIALNALGVIAIQDEPYAAQMATQSLRSMLQRTLLGGPLDEDHRFQAGES